MEYIFLSIKKLSLLLAPGKAIDKEVGLPVLHIFNETKFEDVIDVIVRNKRCVAYNRLNLDIPIRRWPKSVFP